MKLMKLTVSHSFSAIRFETTTYEWLDFLEKLQLFFINERYRKTIHTPSPEKRAQYEARHDRKLREFREAMQPPQTQVENMDMNAWLHVLRPISTFIWESPEYLGLLEVEAINLQKIMAGLMGVAQWGQVVHKPLKLEWD